MKLIYVDTCVFISFITNEMNLHSKLKGEYLYFIFEKFLNKELKMVISTWTLFEIKKVMEYKNIGDEFYLIRNLIDDLKKINNVLIIRYDDKDKEKARKLDNKNYPDALHVVLAKKSHSKILITENISDFKNFKEIIEILHPKDLIQF